MLDAVAPASRWQADRGRRHGAVERHEAFGYAPAFTVARPGTVTVAFVGSWAHGVEVALEIVAWIVVAAALAGRGLVAGLVVGADQSAPWARRRRRSRGVVVPVVTPPLPVTGAEGSRPHDRGGDVSGSLRRALVIASVRGHPDRHRDRRCGPSPSMIAVRRGGAGRVVGVVGSPRGARRPGSGHVAVGARRRGRRSAPEPKSSAWFCAGGTAPRAAHLCDDRAHQRRRPPRARHVTRLRPRRRRAVTGPVGRGAHHRL